MNKDPYVQEVYNIPRVKSFVDNKTEGSIKTGLNYLSAIVKMNSYLKEKYNKNSDSIINYLTDNPKEVYALLGGYIKYLKTERVGITPNTIRNYIAALRSYFAYYDIDVVTAKLKNKVTIPRKIKEKEVPIDASDIRKILVSCNNARLKAYLMVLASSGVRADVEACSIRNCDVDFNSSPTKIKLRGDFTKTKTTRYIYISDEASHFLKEFIQFRGETASEQLLFTSYKNKIPLTYEDTKRIAGNLYTRINIDFMKLLKKVGMDKRKESGLVNKKRHEITLHSFRRFTYSTIEQQVNTGYAEFILGHSNTPYHTQKEGKIREIYLTKCMSSLTILDYSALEATGRDIQSRLEQKDAQLLVLQKRLDSIEEKERLAAEQQAREDEENRKSIIRLRERLKLLEQSKK